MPEPEPDPDDDELDGAEAPDPAVDDPPTEPDDEAAGVEVALGLGFAAGVEAPPGLGGAAGDE